MWKSLRWLESRWSFGASAVALTVTVGLLLTNGTAARAARIARPMSVSDTQLAIPIAEPLIVRGSFADLDRRAVILGDRVIQQGQSVNICGRVLRLSSLSEHEVRFESLDSVDELCLPQALPLLTIPKAGRLSCPPLGAGEGQRAAH